MRKLVILRHAKSSWSMPGMDDFDRPLNERGTRDTPRMAKWLKEQHLIPQQVLCSPAVRTTETLALLCDTIAMEPPTHFDDALYLASSDTILKKVSQLPDDAEVAMVVAHNPGLHDTALNLLSPIERSSAGDMRAAFPTAACAVISLPITHWSNIAWDIGALTSYMVPKALGSVKAS